MSTNCKMWKSYLTFITVAVVFAYALYTPLPVEIRQSWQGTAYMISLKLVFSLARVTTLVGIYSSEAEAQQHFVNLTSVAAKCSVSPQLKISEDSFNGVGVRIYMPVVKPNELGGLIYFHGGGWTVCNLDSHDCMVQDIAIKAAVVVVSVDYRLAPQHKYPAALEDCVKATKHFIENAASFGVAPHRVAVGGDSAGGNLAAAVTIKLRDEDYIPKLCSQILIYPALQALDFRLPSYELYGQVQSLTKEQMIKFWLWYYKGDSSDVNILWDNQHSAGAIQSYTNYTAHTLIPSQYLPTDYHQQFPQSTNVKTEYKPLFSNSYMSPLLAKDLSKLPNTFVLTAQVDVLRDEGLLFVTRLQQLHIPVEHKHFWSSFHGFVMLPKYHEAQEAILAIAEYLKKNV